jgi:DNA invertase Pin-like site-specific DNA recombinase
MSGKPRVIELIRVSTEEQAKEDKGGIPAQKAACKRLAEQYGLDIRWTIQIDGVSGAAVMRSPGLQELLRICRDGHCAGIVVKEESRLMRPGSFGDYSVLGVLQENNVKLYAMDGVIDFSTPQGVMWASLKFAMAGHERMLIRERTTSGRRAKRTAGAWVCGENAVPYGFKLTKDKLGNRLEVDPATIGRVERLFALFVGGVSNYADLARETGIGYHRIRYMLSNPIYTGYHVVRRVADPTGNVYHSDGRLRYQKRVLLPPEAQERIRVLEEAPVDKETFEQAQKLLSLKKELRWGRPNTGRVDPYVYRGFLKCAVCGATVKTVMYTNKGAGFTAEYYVCHNAFGSRNRWSGGGFEVSTASGSCPTRRMRREILEPMLDAVVMEKLANPKFLPAMLEKKHQAMKRRDVKVDIERLEAEIGRLEGRIARSQEMYMDGHVSKAAYQVNYEKLTGELAKVQQKLAKLVPSTPELDLGNLSRMAEPLLQWKWMSSEDKRCLLATMMTVFLVSGKKGKGYHSVDIEIEGLYLNFGVKPALIYL